MKKKIKDCLVVEDGVLRLKCYTYLERGVAEVPDGVVEIGERAFQGCFELESIKIPRGVEVIPSGCFAGCVQLKKLVLPSSCKGAGDDFVDSCMSLSYLVCDYVEIIRKAIQETPLLKFKYRGRVYEADNQKDLLEMLDNI